jgi:lipoprotein-releasing system permease protein
VHSSYHPFDYEKAAQKLLSMDGVTQVIPIIEKQALTTKDGVLMATLCHGISHKNLLEKSLIAKNLVSGGLRKFGEESGDDAIVLGDTLAKRLHARIGDEVIIITPELDETGVGFLHRKKTFHLAATFKSGMYEYDNSVSFIPLDMAQKLFKLQKSVTNISVFVRDPLQVAAVRNVIERDGELPFSSVTDWQNSNSSFMRAVEVERNVMFLILMLITLVASFNIISCMIMLVKNKEKDIAILKTIGLSSASLMQIFFMVGSSIGLCGTFLGACLGLLFSCNIQKIQAILEAACHTKVFSPEVYFLTHLPSVIRPADVLVTVTVSMLLSCLATLYPAKKASQLNPTEILRYA